jgi:opacity protein-like surface antigen
MKTLNKKVLACLGVLVLGSASAFAGPPADYGKNPIAPPPADICGPWFSGISGGVWWVQDYDVHVPFSPFATNDFSFETGFQINVTPIGYRVSETFAVSLETGFYQADVDGVSFGGLFLGATDGQLRLFPAMLNATLTFPINDAISIYAGAGAGVLYRELEATTVIGAVPVGFHDSGWNAVVQARAGVAFEVGHCAFVNVGYRYQHVFASPDDIRGHSVEVGYTFTW